MTMNQQPVLLQMPEELYERVRQIAESSNRSLENVLLESLEFMFGELPGQDDLTPEILETFADDQLWAVAHRPFASIQDARLRELTENSKERALNRDEQNELEMLIDAVDRYVLLRSKALLLLKQRGYDVQQRL
jgi:hypothetical protein